MSQDFTSGCSSAVASLQDDGRVLVNGVYTATPFFDSAVGAYTGEAPSPRDYQALAASIWQHSNDNGLPAALMAGIFAQESHFQENAMNYGDNPHGAGVSQVTALGAKQGYSDYDIAHDADLAIRLGCEWFRSTCWDPWGGNYVKAAASYNAGGPHCGTLSGHQPNIWNLKTFGDYVTPVLHFNNYAIDIGTFDPQNNPANAPPPPAGNDDLGVVSSPAFSPLAALFILGSAFGIAYLATRRS